MSGTRWTADEVDALTRGETPAGRTAKACAEQRRKRGMTDRTRGEQTTYDKFEVAERLGATPWKVVYWRGKGWLLGVRATSRGPGDTSGAWVYTRSAVRALVVRHPDVLGERCDRRWLVRLLAGGGGGSGRRKGEQTG